MKKVQVMIVEDQTMPRQLFELFVHSSERYELAISIDDASMADIYCLKYPVDLILMDVVTRGRESGLAAAEHIKRTYPSIKIIIVTSMPECSYIARARKAGVDSFWYKDLSRHSILEIMDRTMNGESVYPDATPELQLGNASSYEFTDRELTVLREMIGGDTIRRSRIVCIYPSPRSKRISSACWGKPAFATARSWLSARGKAGW